MELIKDNLIGNYNKIRRQGLEPQLTASKAAVLPLDDLRVEATNYITTYKLFTVLKWVYNSVMNKLKLKNYNLEKTLLGGQAFNWDLIDGVYYGFTQDKIIKIKPAPQEDSSLVQRSEPVEKQLTNSFIIEWQTYPGQDNIEFINRYFALTENYDDIMFKIQKDQHIKSAVEKYPGIRILNQDFEQTLLSFILSSHKSIKGVRKLVRDLSQRYGERIIVDSREFCLFPKTEVIANLSEEELRLAGAGFRSRYLKSGAENLLKLRDLGFDFYSDEVNTRQELLKFTGIGEKIADCVMVFSLGFKEVTPLDIWGKRVLIDLYKVEPKMKYSNMREWYKSYFGEFTALAGQFLFEYYRMENKFVSIDKK